MSTKQLTRSARTKPRAKKSKPKRSAFGDVSIPRASYLVADKVYHFTRISDDVTIRQTATTDVVGAIQFNLNQLPSGGDFTALFDQYRIDYVEATFRSQNNMQSITTAALIAPVLYTVIDLDDASAPGSINDLRQYQSCRETRFDHDVTRKIKPRIAIAAYSGTFTSYASQTGWLDCNSNTVQHYGIKYGILAGAGGQTNLGAWTIQYKYYISFKFAR